VIEAKTSYFIGPTKAQVNKDFNLIDQVSKSSLQPAAVAAGVISKSISKSDKVEVDDQEWD